MDTIEYYLFPIYYIAVFFIGRWLYKREFNKKYKPIVLKYVHWTISVGFKRSQWVLWSAWVLSIVYIGFFGDEYFLIFSGFAFMVYIFWSILNSDWNIEPRILICDNCKKRINTHLNWICTAGHYNESVYIGDECDSCYNHILEFECPFCENIIDVESGKYKYIY
jgi:hypothetical protein